MQLSIALDITEDTEVKVEVLELHNPDRIRLSFTHRPGLLGPVVIHMQPHQAEQLAQKLTEPTKGTW